MRKYRKKPVEVEALQWDPNDTSAMREFLAQWYSVVDGVLRVVTLEGTMTAQPGDWIIKGINGEFYPCKPDIFEKTYDRV